MAEQRTYTLADLAPALCPGGSENEVYRVSRRIQNWVTAGLLHPVSLSPGGRGVHRTYDQHEADKARVLLELARSQLPVSRLRQVARLIDNMRPNEERRRDPRIRPPSPGTKKRLKNMRGLWEAAKTGERSIFLIFPLDEPERMNFGEKLELDSGCKSAVVADVTAILAFSS